MLPKATNIQQIGRKKRLNMNFKYRQDSGVNLNSNRKHNREKYTKRYYKIKQEARFSKDKSLMNTN